MIASSTATCCRNCPLLTQSPFVSLRSLSSTTSFGVLKRIGSITSTASVVGIVSPFAPRLKDTSLTVKTRRDQSRCPRNHRTTTPVRSQIVPQLDVCSRQRVRKNLKSDLVWDLEPAIEKWIRSRSRGLAWRRYSSTRLPRLKWGRHPSTRALQDIRHDSNEQGRSIRASVPVSKVEVQNASDGRSLCSPRVWRAKLLQLKGDFLALHAVGFHSITMLKITVLGVTGL